jgi:DNA adenine methylase
MLNGGFGYDRTGGTSKKLANKRANFSIDYAVRLQRVQIECCDALKIIRSRDIADAFFYLDPPYVVRIRATMTVIPRRTLMPCWGVLETLQGKFLLSSFRNKALTDFTRRNGWHTLELKMACSMTHGYKTQRGKIELLTANYPIQAPDKRSRKAAKEAEKER